jgi:hypothetical protein
VKVAIKMRGVSAARVVKEDETDDVDVARDCGAREEPGMV